MLSFEDALKTTLSAVRAVETESVALLAAGGRVLRAPVKADRDLPPFDRSERDGFAVRAEDCSGGRATLLIHERTIYAGDEPGGAIEAGTAVRIMTGAPLPDGANVAVPVEKTGETAAGADSHVESESEARARVTIDYPAIKPGLHVHPRGADAAAGALLLEAGTVLGPSEIAAAASVGAGDVIVSRRLRISALSTGDELVAIDETPGPASIRDCNGPVILAMASAHPWIHAVASYRAPDDRDVLRKTIARALDDSDVLVLSGGVSMGTKDFVPAVLADLGVEQIFHKTAIRPGKPLWLGAAPNGAHVFGLPGNPVAVQVTFREIVMPALRKLAGLARTDPLEYVLPLAAPVSKSIPFRQFVPARIVRGTEVVRPGDADASAGKTSLCSSSHAMPIAHRGSGDFVSAARAEGVIVLPEGPQELAPGDPVAFHPWGASC